MAMSEKEKELRIGQIDAALRCGGGKLTPDIEADIRDIFDGKKTSDQVRAELDKKYRRPI